MFELGNCYSLSQLVDETRLEVVNWNRQLQIEKNINENQWNGGNASHFPCLKLKLLRIFKRFLFLEGFLSDFWRIFEDFWGFLRDFWRIFGSGAIFDGYFQEFWVIKIVNWNRQLKLGRIRMKINEMKETRAVSPVWKLKLDASKQVDGLIRCYSCRPCSDMSVGRGDVGPPTCFWNRVVSDGYRH